MKAMLGGLTAIHSAGRIYGVNPAWSLAGLPSSMTIRYTEEAHGEIEHPVVRTHVETGRKCLSMGNNTRCGVLDHILGLRKDQPAREPKGKTLPGWALWCSGARTVPALGADLLCAGLRTRRLIFSSADCVLRC